MGNVREKGVALVVAMLFLLVVTILGVSAARNSSMSLKLSSNLQDQYTSFQASEAGIFATLALAETADDPFIRDDLRTPLSGLGYVPLSELDDPNSVDVKIDMLSIDGQCPRAGPGRGGTGVDTFTCDYYRIDSEHSIERRSRTRTSMGVVKTLIGSI